MLKFAQAAIAAAVVVTAPPCAYAQTSIDDAAWLAGRWIGEGLGGQMEEIWSPPAGGRMSGHFQLITNGEVSFYEIMVLDIVEGGLRIRVKHFNADFTGWEERDEWSAFEPVSANPDVLSFNGLVIYRHGADAIEMRLMVHHDDGAVREHVLTFRRAPL